MSDFGLHHDGPQAQRDIPCSLGVTVLGCRHHVQGMYMHIPTYRYIQTETETDRDGQRPTETKRDRQRQTETDRDRQRQTETDRHTYTYNFIHIYIYREREREKNREDVPLPRNYRAEDLGKDAIAARYNSAYEPLDPSLFLGTPKAHKHRHFMGISLP